MKAIKLLHVHVSESTTNIPRVGRPNEIDKTCSGKKNSGKVLRELTNEFNKGGNFRVYPNSFQKILHQNKIFRRVVREKMVVREVNKIKRLSWCLERRRWTVNQNWSGVMLSDESQNVIG